MEWLLGVVNTPLPETSSLGSPNSRSRRASDISRYTPAVGSLPRDMNPIRRHQNVSLVLGGSRIVACVPRRSGAGIPRIVCETVSILMAPALSLDCLFRPESRR